MDSNDILKLKSYYEGLLQSQEYPREFVAGFRAAMWELGLSNIVLEIERPFAEGHHRRRVSFAVGTPHLPSFSDHFFRRVVGREGKTSWVERLLARALDRKD